MTTNVSVESNVLSGTTRKFYLRFTHTESGQSLVRGPAYGPAAFDVDAFSLTLVDKYEEIFKSLIVERDPEGGSGTTKDEARAYWWKRIFNAMLDGTLTDLEAFQQASNLAADSNQDVASWVGLPTGAVNDARSRLDTFLAAVAQLDHGRGKL